MKELFNFVTICFVGSFVYFLFTFQLFIATDYALLHYDDMVIGVASEIWKSLTAIPNIILASPSLLIAIIIARKTKTVDSPTRKRQLLVLVVIYLICYLFVFAVDRTCHGPNALGCVYLFSPFILLAFIVGSCSGILFFILSKEWFGVKQGLLFLIFALAINIILAIPTLKKAIAERKEEAEAIQESKIAFGYLYKPDPKEYEIISEYEVGKGENRCVLFISNFRDGCFFETNQRGVYRELINKNFPREEALIIIELAPRDWEEDTITLSQKMNIVVRDTTCNYKIAYRKDTSVGNKDKAIYGIIKSEDGKCLSEIHFLLVYKADAFLVIKASDSIESEDVSLEDLLMVAESLQ